VSLRLDDLVKNVIGSEKLVNLLSLSVAVLPGHGVDQFVEHPQGNHLFFHVKLQETQRQSFPDLIYQRILLTDGHDSL
jgi:hypothetical protein